MKKVWKKLTITVALCVGFLCVGNLSVGDFSLCMTAYANEEEKIESGIYVNDINLAGMTVSEAKKAVQDYVDSLTDTEIIFHAGEGQEITVTASDC